MRALLVLMLTTLCGCASQVLSIHSLPNENPAADNAAAAANAAAFADAAATASTQAAPVVAETKPSKDEDAKEPEGPPVTPADAPPMYTYDPFERLNRFTYRFNARFDEAIFLPVTNTYLRIPSPLRTGVHNFFDNLAEVDSTVNYLLQWRLKNGLRSLGRFVVNSTVGLGGLFDVASQIKLSGYPTGFATTLATWGMHPGFYLVLPLIGPSTFRDGLGFAADYATEYGIDVAHLYRGNVSWGLGVANAVDQRAHVSFRYYATGSPFEYEDVRFLYVRKRLIEDEGLHDKEARKRPPADAPAGK